VNGTYYVHVGDLDWWLYYLPADSPPWQNIYLWDDKENPGSLAAWSLLSPAWNSFDVFISPHGTLLPRLMKFIPGLKNAWFRWSIKITMGESGRCGLPNMTIG